MKDHLVKIAQKIFVKTSGLIYIYQFRDFVRPEQNGPSFKANDRIRIKDDVNTWDIYDEELEAGMEGIILGKGQNHFDWSVAFILRSGDVLEIDIDRDDLEIVQTVIKKEKNVKKHTKKGKASAVKQA